ncbi:hypothetical protein LCGC14_2957660, partial [marine sediment metagenome]
MKPTTLQNYRTFVSIFLSWLGEKSLSPSSFARFLTEYRLTHALASTQAVFSAVRIFLTAIGEVDRLGGIKRPRGESPAKQAYTEEELTTLFELLKANKSIVGRRDLAIASVLLYLGLRAGEVCSLQLDDLGTKLESLTVAGGKTRHARRTIPLVDFVTNALTSYLRRSRPKLINNEKCTHLFIGIGGKPLTRNSIALMLGRKNVPFKVGAHKFRHTFITRHALAQTNPALIGQLAGWSPRTLVQQIARYT